MNAVFLSQSKNFISFQQGEHVTCLTIYSEASVIARVVRSSSLKISRHKLKFLVVHQLNQFNIINKWLVYPHILIKSHNKSPLSVD